MKNLQNIDDWEKEFDKEFSPQIGNATVCYDCGTDFIKLKSFISSLLKQARADERERIKGIIKKMIADNKHFLPTIEESVAEEILTAINTIEKE